MPKGTLIIKGNYEWFEEKNDLNIKNHKGISFADITSVFDDPYFFEIYDQKHSKNGQDRYNGFGIVNNMFIVIQIVYTETCRKHIISARHATSNERKEYYDRIRKLNS